jgi:hypothetical protein
MFARHIGGAEKKNLIFLISVMLCVFAAAAIVGVGAFIDAAKNKSTDYGDHGAYLGKFETLSKGQLPGNISERFADWKLFGTSIIENPRTMLFGHATPLPREVRTSAHNLYLDIVYSFGLISLLPLLVLSGYTVHLFQRARSILTLETRWLAFIVLFLVVIDSNFKVSLRQPYPGIFGYFLWGLLLTRLHGSCRAHIRSQAPVK